MQPFDEHAYVPALLTKQGERRALADLPTTTADRLRPPLVVPAPDWDYEDNRPKKTLDEHLTSSPADLVQTWGHADAFVDASQVGDRSVFGGTHPLVWLCDNASALGLSLTPVVAVQHTDAYVEAAAEVAAVGGDACVRLTSDHWLRGGPTDVLDELLADLYLEPSDVHLVLDLEDDVSSTAGRATLTELQQLPYVDDWASLTVLAAGFPSDVPAGGSTVHTMGRFDWRIYLALCSQTLPRVPTFGDYGINGPGTGLNVDPKLLTIAATLRYTVDQDWLVSKGLLFKASGGRGLGGQAVPPAAQALINHGEYMGAEHCGCESWLEVRCSRWPAGERQHLASVRNSSPPARGHRADRHPARPLSRSRTTSRNTDSGTSSARALHKRCRVQLRRPSAALTAWSS